MLGVNGASPAVPLGASYATVSGTVTTDIITAVANVGGVVLRVIQTYNPGAGEYCIIRAFDGSGNAHPIHYDRPGASTNTHVQQRFNVSVPPGWRVQVLQNGAGVQSFFSYDLLG
jgi:hypothetical protein